MKVNPVTKKFIIFSFALVYLLIAIVIPTNFSVTMPGEMNQVVNNITIENTENSKNFYTTSVYYMTKITPIMRYVLQLSNKNEVEEMTKFEKTISLTDDYQMGQVSKTHSYHVSLVNAYTEANKVDNTITIDYEINSLVLYYRPSKISGLKIGDIVTKVNGQNITKENYEEIIASTKTSSLNLTIKRGNEERDYQHNFQKGDYYFSFYPNITITNSVPKFTLPGLDSTTGGPSGGLMQTLNIYASLLKLNFGELKIGGTGTLDLAGNVGKIGGAVQKIYTANFAKMDMFFIAVSNDSEVINIDKKFEYYPVIKFSEAVEILLTKIVS